MATLTAVKAKILQLGAGDFQILCDNYLTKEGYSNLVALGTEAGTAKTTRGTPDSYFINTDGKYIFAEYTTQRTNLPAKIISDIKKCLDVKATGIKLSDITEIVYCHTSSNVEPKADAEIRELCKPYGIQLTMIGIDQLAQGLLNNYPSLLKDHLGISIDTEQIQSAEDFLLWYDSNPLAAKLDTIFQYREKEVESLNTKFENTDVVILSGVPGVGKTRLALEFARVYSQQNHEQLYCIHSKDLEIFEDLKTYLEVPQDYFILIDDANALSQLKLVLEYTNKKDKGYNVKILITVRNYAIQKIRNDLGNIVPHDELEIKAFSDDEIKGLVQKNLGIQHSHFLNRIAEISEGNARIAILAGKIAIEQNSLNAIRDVTQLYEAYYGKTFMEAGLDRDKNLLIAAGLIAFLHSVHLDQVTLLTPILDNLNMDKDAFCSSVNRLFELEIVDIYFNKAAIFADQCFENYILKYVFYDKKLISLASVIEICFPVHSNRTVQAINALLGTFQIKGVHSFAHDEILKVWRKLRDSHHPHFKEFVKVFYHVNEVETLLLLQERIEQESCVTIAVEDLEKDHINTDIFSDSEDILSILAGFADSDENIESALDLFFQYYLKRPDLYKKIYEKAINKYGLINSQNHSGYGVPLQFIEKLFVASDNWENSYLTILFINTAEEWLHFEFSSYEGNRHGTGINICRLHLIPNDALYAFRCQIWTHLIAIGKKSIFCDRIQKLIHNYGFGVDESNLPILKEDYSHLCELIAIIFPSNSALKCLTLKSVLNRIKKYGIDCDKDFADFILSFEYKWCSLLCGPELDSDLSYEERNTHWKEQIVRTIREFPDRGKLAARLVPLAVDAASCELRDTYQICTGFNYALPLFMESKDSCFQCMHLIAGTKISDHLDFEQVFISLFSFFNAFEIYDHILKIDSKYRNRWLFEFFCRLPQKDIDKAWVDRLYDFLKDDSDKYINSSPYRRLSFLDNYTRVDPYIWIKASEILCQKHQYSPYVFNLYFTLLFHSGCFNSEIVLKKFEANLKLLERIYLLATNSDCLVDLDGAFLHAICNQDPRFLNLFVHQLCSTAHLKSKEDTEMLRPFWDDEDFISKVDTIVLEAQQSFQFPDINMPTLIQDLLKMTSANDLASERSKQWGSHFIKEHCHCITEMNYFLEAIADFPNEEKKEYISLFLNYNQSYNNFEHLHLLPNSSSWSGSCVPLFSGRIEYLRSLLSLLHGIAFLKHKQHIEKLIKFVQEDMKQNQISDILRG